MYSLNFPGMGPKRTNDYESLDYDSLDYESQSNSSGALRRKGRSTHWAYLVDDGIEARTVKRVATG